MWIPSNINRLSLVVALVGLSLYGGCVLISFKQNKVKLTMGRIPKGRRLIKKPITCHHIQKDIPNIHDFISGILCYNVPCFLKVQIAYSCETNICHG
jgi:hypothetical protein